MATCVFCDSAFADPILPQNRQKIYTLFDVSFNGKKLLHDGKICSRCQLQVEVVDSAVKLKLEMNQCLQEKLKGSEELSSSLTNGNSPGYNLDLVVVEGRRLSNPWWAYRGGGGTAEYNDLGVYDLSRGL